MHQGILVSVLLAWIGISLSVGAVTITGGGASFPASLYSRWINVFEAKYGQYFDTIQYTPTSSSTGFNDLLSGKLNFAGSDVPPNTNDTTFIYFPSAAGAIAITYNIPDLSVPVNLTRQNLVSIFTGQITTWDHDDLKADNPFLAAALTGFEEIPTIQLVVRKPGSGTTRNFATALHKFDSIRFTTTPSASLDWGTVSNRRVLVAATNAAVGMLVASIPYSISYMDLNEVYSAETSGIIGVANIRNEHGQFVAPSVTSIQAAMSVSDTSTITDMNEVLLNSHLKNAYPITIATYIVVHNNAIAGNIEAARWTLRYIYWTLTEGSSLAITSNFAPLDSTLTTYSITKLQSLSFSPTKALYGQSVCDFPANTPTGCKHGSCYLNLPFQVPDAQCICDAGYTNYNGLDCSESSLFYHVRRDDPYALISLAAMALGLCIVLAMTGLVFWLRDQPAIKAIAPTLCWVLLTGCLIGLLGIVMYAGLPTDVTCKARLFFPPVAFGMTFGMMALKLWRIYLIFGYQRKRRISTARNSVLLASTSVIAFFEIFLVALWVGLSSPHVRTVIQNKTTGAVYQECGVDGNKENIFKAFEVTLYAVNALLLIGCLILAIKTRGAYARFSESKSIGFSIYVISILVTFGVPVVYILPTTDTASRGIRKLLVCLIMFFISTGVACILFIPRLIEGMKAKGKQPARKNQKPTSSPRTSDTGRVHFVRNNSIVRTSVIGGAPLSGTPTAVGRFKGRGVYPVTCEVGIHKNQFGAQWKSAQLWASGEMDLVLFLDAANTSKVITSFKITHLSPMIIDDSVNFSSVGSSAGGSTGSDRGQRAQLLLTVNDGKGKIQSWTVEFQFDVHRRQFLSLLGNMKEVEEMAKSMSSLTSSLPGSRA